MPHKVRLPDPCILPISLSSITLLPPATCTFSPFFLLPAYIATAALGTLPMYFMFLPITRIRTHSLWQVLLKMEFMNFAEFDQHIRIDPSVRACIEDRVVRETHVVVPYRVETNELRGQASFYSPFRFNVGVHHGWYIDSFLRSHNYYLIH
jgi:hypothetical protein